ncbi:MAG TPA: hypothetical protein VGG95_01860 [Edaphobacter sp.]
MYPVLMPRDRRPFIILPLAAFIAIAPLLLRGCSCGHDFDFHLINWFEAARQFTHGTLHPHWAFTPAWNAGEPRFVFYPPLSWVTGALLGLLMPWTWTPIVYTWLCLTAAGFSLYSVARSYATQSAALVAAVIYIANPYTLYTAYERSAYAELLAAAWLPLALHAVLKREINIPSVAIPVALLWLTNAPAAVMGCYAMACIVLLRLVLSFLSSSPTRPSASRLSLNSLLGVLLGLGLSSFYLIPAAYERRFVLIDYAILPGLRPWDNFLFQHTNDPEHDIVLRTASIVALILITLTAIALLSSVRTNRRNPSSYPLATSFQPTQDGVPQPQDAVPQKIEVSSRPERTARSGETRFSTINFHPPHSTIPLIPLAIVLVLMLTPLSAPLWRHLPELRFLQFPWRLLAVLAVIFGLATARALSGLSPRRPTTIAILSAIVFVIPSYYAFRQFCYPEDTAAERLHIFQSANPGTDPTDEYTPVNADNDLLSQTNPGYWLGKSVDAPPPSSSTPAPAPRQLNLSPIEPATLVLNLRNYPAWRITLNHFLVSTRLKRKDGLIAIPLPAGTASIAIEYVTLPDQRLGYLLTVVSILALASLLLRANHETTLPQPELRAY